MKHPKRDRILTSEQLLDFVVEWANAVRFKDGDPFHAVMTEGREWLVGRINKFFHGGS